jgi:hypothetical protein
VPNLAKMATQHSALTDDSASTSSKSVPPQKLAGPRQIPWGYGRDRVTATAVDPDRLFAYWEIKDESIEQARAQLGGRAALVLRIYDTSGRIFDGANAHGYFDQDVQRSDRQWFCHVGKPDSSAHVEMGMRGFDGRFIKIVRSGRVDFPRASPAPPRPTEWMRVVAATGDIVGRDRAANDPAGGPGGPGQADSGGPAIEGGPMPSAGTASGGTVEVSANSGVTPIDSYEVVSLEPGSYRFERQEYEVDSGWQSESSDPETVYRTITSRWEEFGFGTSSWETTPVESAWEAGPFNFPTEVIVPAAERFEHPTRVYKAGEEVRVLHGPWQVVIRGIQAHASRKVLARWEVHRSWVSVTSRTVDALAPHGSNKVNGASSFGGASERFALAASELRLRGASELFMLGASERRLGGASELRFLGASQWAAKGASERRLLGGSEWRLAGASEYRLAGASERRMAGASERMLSGASERRLSGASERRLGGASERRAGASEPRLGALRNKE